VARGRPRGLLVGSSAASRGSGMNAVEKATPELHQRPPYQAVGWRRLGYASTVRHRRGGARDVSLPAPIWPPAVRRCLEVEALIACACPVAEAIAAKENWPRRATYVRPTAVERMLDEVAALTEGERGEIAACSP
jgi:hypothetical protein